MIGKVVKISENDLTFGKEASFIEIYSCFKIKKNGNKYIIYKHQDSNILSFGSVYFKPNAIIIIDIKDNNEFIKEYTHNLIYKKDLSAYEILDIKDIEKAEIISENTLEVKPETLSTLYDLTIPKPEIKVETKPKKKNKGLIFIILFIILLGCAAILYFYQDKIFGVKKEIYCSYQYKDKELNTNILEEVLYNFGRRSNVESINRTITYTFDSSDEYNSFKNNNAYYDYIIKNSTYQFDDINYVFKQFVPIDLENNNLPEEYDEVISYFELKQYTCSENNE